MDKWEYLSVVVQAETKQIALRSWPTGKLPVDELNKLGEQGWELVSIAPVIDGGNIYAAVLKRRKP